MRRLAARRASWAEGSERLSSGAASGAIAAPATVTCHLSRSWRCWPGLIQKEVEHRPPLEILAELRAIEQEILQGIEELEGMLR
ncbi:hypothetical protein LBMAG41_16780 [Cyanobium sp.]|nr:hypothetical protein LBMAG41_16780 [Cyanobium sp.]